MGYVAKFSGYDIEIETILPHFDANLKFLGYKSEFWGYVTIFWGFVAYLQAKYLNIEARLLIL